jgi:cation diffusion facilitator family transporter
MDDLAIQKQKAKVASLSIISNSVLVVFKAVIGILIGSVSVFSEAIHSGMDLIAAVIAFLAVRISGRQADEGHPFGHAKVEDISALAEALLIFVAAGWIIYEAIHKLIVPRPLEMPALGVMVMFISSAANFMVSQRLFHVGKQTDSPALLANGWHLRTDVYTSLGVMVGLGLILLGRYVFPGVNISWIDPVMAITVAVMILRAAYHLASSAVQDLLDKSTSSEEKAWIQNYLYNLYPTVRSFHKLRTRKAGDARFVDLHIAVHAQMTVSDSHHVADQIMADFRTHFPHIDVILHIEPCDGSCSSACTSGCLLSAEERTEAVTKGSK